LYCKPVINPNLSKFCTDLTGIRQDQVENADVFEIVLKKVKQWLDQHELGTKYKYAIATDG
jgi:inhibitor of KinA sporulation pathway (predicted exonuclease)